MGEFLGGKIAPPTRQHGMKHGSGGPPIRYEAVEKCLEKVSQKALEIEATVHMPRIGCGLAGGKWEHIEPIIFRTLSWLARWSLGSGS